MCYSCSNAGVLLSHINPPRLVWGLLVVLLYHSHCHLGRIKSKNLSEPQRKSLTLENDTACKWQVSVPRSECIMGCISEKSHYDLQAKSNDNKTLHKKPIPDSTSNSFIKKNTTMWNEKPREPSGVKDSTGFAINLSPIFCPTLVRCRGGISPALARKGQRCTILKE